MSSRGQLDAYIAKLEGRLRLGALLRGAAILTSAALVATVLLVLIANHFAFSTFSLTSSRILLLIVIAFAVGFGLAIPLYGLDRRRAAGTAEIHFPEFQQRLVTFTERDLEGRDPFLELLAADTMSIAQKNEPKLLFSDLQVMGAVGTGAVSLAILVWMIVAGPGYLGHGASLLWLGTAHSGAPLYDLQVAPGNVTVRRNADQVVTAQLLGIQPDQVHLYARYHSASKWDQVVMQPQPGSSGYQFLLAGIPEDVEYYVEAGPLQSKHFNIQVADLPSIKGIRVTYHFPSWTGMAAAVEERSGDLSAVEGTQAELQITTDKPLKNGVLMFDTNQQLQLSGSGNVYTGTVNIQKDGLYHIAALDHDQSVRLSEDYFIEASPANAPDVRIMRPGKDYRASPIEEITVAVNAADEFGLQDMQLHYSVNGGTEYTVPLLKQKGGKEADGSTVISLEPYKLVPGDLISLYATAKDAHAEARSDMLFVQADPYEREFSQSQQSGGGSGGGGGNQGNQQAEISQREKEIIASTWRQQGEKNVPPAKAIETAKFLSDVQTKLHDQALSLSGRLDARELSDENQTFGTFQQDMTAAAEAMQPAADKLGAQKWKDAIPQEQKALQHLLRAEATFRQIQVAFGARGGGGGAGGDSAGRDLASLFDLELDTEKNQYETAQTANADKDKKEQDIDDVLKKLDELAHRQQDLANQPKNAQDAQSRYQQDMLRREAEELQRQIEQMNKNGQQSGQGGQPNPSGSDSGQQPQPGGQGNGQGTPDSRVQQAVDQMRQANDDMRRATQAQDQADARRAAERLRDAQSLLGGIQNQQGGQQLNSLVKEGDRIASEQKKQDDQLKQAFNGGRNEGQQGNSPQNNGQQGSAGGGVKPGDLNRLASDRQQLGQDLARLEKQMQDSTRELAGGNKSAASKLRDALSQAESSDLQNRIQKSTDWIRRGIDPNSNAGETAIGSDLDKLSDQLHQAEQAMGNGQDKNPQQALDRVDRFRDQMDALARGMGDKLSRNSQGQNGQGGQQAGGQAGGGQQGGGGKGGQPGMSANATGAVQGGLGGNNGGRAPGTVGGFDPGSFEAEGGTERQPVPVTQEDMDRAYQAAMEELNDLRTAVKDEPGALSDISELKNQLQHLDPKRFPGNPAMLQELHTQVSATVDKLELQLQREADNVKLGQIRSGDSQPAPPGYADAVAEYFRKLSNKNP